MIKVKVRSHLTRFVRVAAIVAAGLAAASNTAGAAAGAQSSAPDGAPNVVVVLLDDVGFGATATFGGPARTPTLEALAQRGLRYNRFHTTAICSPTRASLLTGRDPHVAGVGAVLNSAIARPGYEGVLKKETATIAEVLRQHGYSTAAFGKWHLTPAWEASPAGPFDRWPTGAGFEKFYGFLGGETDQFEPSLIEGTRPVFRPDGDNYHLTEDLANQAIRWIRMQQSLTPAKPFFVYFAPGATHAPLQVPPEWIERYKGSFDEGWDAMRERIFAQQKRLGVIPADAKLTPRPKEMPAWDSLSADEKRVATRLMEVYAAYLEHTDVQIGRLVNALKEGGQFDNTLFIYVVGDNGSSAEGDLLGSINYMGAMQGVPESTARKLARLDEIGSRGTHPQYPAGWAWALDTPFQWVKQVASHLGGTRTPMVVTWPARIKDSGGLRSQFGHVNDIAPTILEAVGLRAPEFVSGVRQLPMDGVSLLYSFPDERAPERHTTQYFEVNGNRAIYHTGWLASAFHGKLPWNVARSTPDRPVDDDVWELYDLSRDFSQADDRSAEQSDKLKEMRTLFDKEAARVRILPLRDASAVRPGTGLPSLSTGRTEFTYYPGAAGIPESAAPRLFNRSWTLKAEIDVPQAGGGGVIATMGGHNAGWTLYLDKQARAVFEYRTFEAARIKLVDAQALAPGKNSLQVDFDYDGGGYGKGGAVTLAVNGRAVAGGRLQLTPPAVFSIDETFDLEVDSGSPAGDYPQGAALGYPLPDGVLKVVDIRLR